MTEWTRSNDLASIVYYSSTPSKYNRIMYHMCHTSIHIYSWFRRPRVCIAYHIVQQDCPIPKMMMPLSYYASPSWSRVSPGLLASYPLCLMFALDFAFAPASNPPAEPLPPRSRLSFSSFTAKVLLCDRFFLTLANASSSSESWSTRLYGNGISRVTYCHVRLDLAPRVRSVILNVHDKHLHYPDVQSQLGL
jgi:hypothetical protein